MLEWSWAGPRAARETTAVQVRLELAGPGPHRETPDSGNTRTGA